jgi:2-methylcitrate dehydratase PrpD
MERFSNEVLLSNQRERRLHLKHAPTVAAAAAGILLVLATARGTPPPSPIGTVPEGLDRATTVSDGGKQQTRHDDSSIRRAIWYYEREEMSHPINHDV